MQLSFNQDNMKKIIELDLKNKKITVQAGATWGQIQESI